MVESVVQSPAEIVVDSTEKPKIRVLHVDDDSALLKIARQCLEIQGPFQVESATSADEALAKLENGQYDAVVSAYQMPGRDGLEFLELLRKNGNTIPFIMFTGKGREAVAVKAWGLGADHYVNKIGDPETVYCELAHCLRSIVEKRLAETRMKETTQKLQTIYQSALEGISYVDAEENILYANKAFADIVGYVQDQLVGMNLHKMVDDENWAKIRSATERRTKGEANRYEIVFRRSDGTVRNVLVSGAPLFEQDGRFAGTVGIILDTTERKKIETALRESQKKYQDLTETISDFVWEMDSSGRYTYCSPQMEKLWGIKPTEMIGKTPFDMMPPNEKEKALQYFGAMGNSPKPFCMESKSYDSQGHLIFLETKGVPFLDDKGRLLGFRGISRDITERKKTEEALKTEREELDRIFNSSPIIVFYKDKEGKFLRVNRAFAEAVQMSQEDFVGKTVFDFYSAEIAQSMTNDDLEVLESGCPKLGIIEQYESANGLRWVQTDKVPIFSENGSPNGIIGFAQDITERRKTEEVLRQSEEKYRGLFESVQDPVGIFVGREGRLIDCNTAFKKSSGYTDEELKGKVFPDFVHPDDRDMVLEKYRTEYSEDEFPLVYEIRGLNKKGESVPLELSVSTFKKKGKVIGIEVIHRDLTERKKIETSLRESHQKFEGLFRHNPEAAVYLGLNFKIVDVNPRFCELFGYSAEEAKGKDLDDLVVPEGMREEAESLNKNAKNGYASRDTARKRKNGSLVPVSISAAPVAFEDKLLGYVGIYKDITDLKKLEEKLRVVGGLTRHDVRNKLSAVTGNAYLLKRKLAADPEALEQLADMENAVRNAELIFEFARKYEQLGIEQLVNLNVGNAVDEAASLFPGLKGIKIVNECHGLTVLADSLLRTLFYNLIDDSLKYGEKLNQIRIHYEKAEENRLRLVYEDDGVGIALDAKSKIFNEGYTTGKGSGLGLYMVKRILDVYGWTIQETGTPDNGARFTIVIPNKNHDDKENYQLH
jgi:PAS domain S-box-containing protein